MTLAWAAQDKRVTRKAVFTHSWICGRAGEAEQLQVLGQGIALARRLGAQDTEGRLLLSRAKAQLSFDHINLVRQDLVAAHTLPTSPSAATALTLFSLLAGFLEGDQAEGWLTLCLAQARRAGHPDLVRQHGRLWGGGQRSAGRRVRPAGEHLGAER